MKHRIARPAWLFLILLLLVGADFLVWHLATARLRTAFSTFQRKAEAAGWQLTAAPPATAGFPLAATLVLPHARVAQSGGLAWRAARVRVTLSWLHPKILRITADGAQALILPGGTRVAFTGPIAARLPWSHAVQAIPLSLGPITLPTARGTITLQSARARLMRDTASLALTAGPILLPQELDAGLGSRIGMLSLAATLHPAWPAGPGATAATAWRQAGGTLDLDHFVLSWGPARATARGTARLDDTLQPVAHIALTLDNEPALLHALVQSGTISPGAALAAGAVLALLNPTGAAQTVPVEIKHTSLMVARIPLARLPHLAWGSDRQ